MMKWRRWLFGIVCILALAGLYSARRPIVTSFLSSRFSTRLDTQSLETSFENSAIQLRDASIELIDGRTVRIDQANATIDTRTFWNGDLIVDQLDTRGVRIPMQIPNSTQLTLPWLPDDFGAVPDVQSWIEPWLSEFVGRIDRDADRVVFATRELQSRADELQADLERTLASNPSNLHDRKYAALLAKEYHAIKQRLAELRIQARNSGRDQAKQWSTVSESLSDRFQTRLREMAPDADRQIQQLARAYSQRITPTVLGYCDLVTAVMNPRSDVPTKDASSRTTLIRKASLAGEFIDLKNSNSRVPFECQSCQWAWDTPTKLPTTSVWSFELPDGHGSLEIQAEQRVLGKSNQNQQNQIDLNCYWYMSKGNQPFQANPSRVRVAVQQSDEERVVSVSAPWDPRQEDLATQHVGLSPLTISFRQRVRDQDRSKQRSIPVAWESIAVEPRILFELENSLEKSKQRWVSEAQTRWNQIVPTMITTKQEQSTQVWQRLSAQAMDQLISLEAQLNDWQKRWDCSTSLVQYRVGNRLSAHPDAYSLGAN